MTTPQNQPPNGAQAPEASDNWWEAYLEDKTTSEATPETSQIAHPGSTSSTTADTNTETTQPLNIPAQRAAGEATPPRIKASEAEEVSAAAEPPRFTRGQRLGAWLGLGVVVAGGIAGGIAYAVERPGKSAPKAAAAAASPTPKAAHSTVPNTTPTPDNTGPTNIPNFEQPATHTFNFSQSTLDKMKTNSDELQATHEEVIAFEQKINGLDKYGLLDQASSANPRTALGALFAAYQLAFQKNDASIAVLPYYNDGADATAFESLMTNLINDKAIYPLLAINGNTDPLQLATDPYIGNGDYSEVAKPPYYKITPSTGQNANNLASAEVAVNFSMVSAKEGKAFTEAGGTKQLIGNDMVYTLEQIDYVRDGKPMKTWLVNIVNLKPDNSGQ